MNPVEQTRVACYAVVFDNNRRLLLCRLGPELPHFGRWTLPGGGIDFGEDLESAVVREVKEETGLDVEVTGVLDAHSELFNHPDRQMQAVRIVYTARVVSGDLRDEKDGTTDKCQFFSRKEIEGLPYVGLVRRILKMVWDQIGTE